MKRYKLFLASSEELAQERKEIALLISRLNNKWTEEKDIYIELVVWEDLLHSFQKEGERIQDYFNREMLKCDIVLALFFKKVGQFTREEFNVAYENLEKCKKPEFLFVYFKSGTLTIDEVTPDILKISELKKQIQGLQQIYVSFNSIEDLTLKLQHQLELVIQQKKEIEAIVTEADKEARALSDFEHYKQHIWAKFRYLDFTGLNAILQKPLELECIYVKLCAKKSIAIERYRNIIDTKRIEIGIKKKKPKNKNNDFVSLFEQLHNTKQKEREPLRMLILGHPGSGKTTLMKWITLQCLKADKKNLFSQFTPIFIPLKDFGRDPDNTFRKKNIGNLIIEILARENSAVDSFLDDHMKTSRLLFLLDGLDEIGDEKIRREVIDWIQKQYIFQNALIVTSRFSGLNPAEGLTFKDDITVFEIQDFELKDIDLFLKNWYRNVEIAVAGERDMQKAIETGQTKYGELMDIIKEKGHRNLRELAVNPLLLTIIAIVHRTRAVLPRDRHKLYEECLKVMVELWNLANRKLNISFSFDSSITNLSKIAVRLMQNERRDMEKKEIDSLLPDSIENQTRDFFLKEMVLKAGLLYESEGKYGFLHLTFQEYLAARFFANSKNPNEILVYRDKDYWRETFKLFVNTGNAELFFDEVMDNLVKKKYWQNLELFEVCLREIALPEKKESVALNFAKKVVQELMVVAYKDKNDKLIVSLSNFLPIYEQGIKMVPEGWALFNSAPHPYCQSVGTSILNRADEKTLAELMNCLRQRIEGFENSPAESSETQLYFLLQNRNNFALQINRRGKLTDFIFALDKCKSRNNFIRYLFLQVLVARVDLVDLRDLVDLGDLVDLRALRDLRNLRALHSNYINKYKANYEKNETEILAWAYQAIEKLHGLSNKKLLKYFSNTTPDELKEFRESYMEIIATELSKGNYTILSGKKLTKKQQKRVEEAVTFDTQTVEKMLDFVLDASHDEKQALQLKAFEILRNKDYEKLHTTFQSIIAANTTMKIRFNALYMIEKIM